MGETEQVIVEPDELKEKEEVEGLHPSTLWQQNPTAIANFITTVSSFVAANGWYIVVTVLLGYFTWGWLEPKMRRWLKKGEDEHVFEFRQSPEIHLAKRQVMDAARQRQQERYNKDVAARLEKKEIEKAKEDQKAQLESQEVGEGAKKKLEHKKNAPVSASRNSSAINKPASKVRLRPEYNPLTGDTGASSSCRWKPSGRGPSGGG